MAGHSKWHQIRHKKAARDSKIGKIFTKHGKLITIAARDGGGDPAMNPTLRNYIQNAKADNMPNLNIERAIKKGTGELNDGTEFSEVYYEAFGPAGVAFYIHVITDNKNRSFGSLRTLINKNGGNMGEAGSVGWIFERRGLLTVELPQQADLEVVELDLIDCGAIDLVIAKEDQRAYVYTGDQETNSVASELGNRGYLVAQKELTFMPKQTVALQSETDVELVTDLIDLIDDDEDVQNVYTNAEFSE
ncbi:YebC/PmpR family DNA-binding transcriptional regulator [Candidatus Gracilibacteria bacterium]|jgi:YebC/PmpR family DNA-binding regulatory protein|nr:YebC/PmpR family DNA-binding transcriptional regulator [Candidatus Gracilibacteria bacterium]